MQYQRIMEKEEKKNLEGKKGRKGIGERKNCRGCTECLTEREKGDGQKGCLLCCDVMRCDMLHCVVLC